MFKWKHDATVVGALELQSDLGWRPHAALKPLEIPNTRQTFEECLTIWKEEKLGKSLAEALKNIPPETKCCGLITDPEDTIRSVVPLLNQGWVKKVNEWSVPMKMNGYSIDAFVWSWSQVAGSAETVKLLIRFHAPRIDDKSTAKRQDSNGSALISDTTGNEPAI